MENLEDELGRKDPVELVSLGRALKEKTTKGPDVLDSYRKIGNILIDKDEPLLAFPLIDEGLKSFPKDDRLRQLLGLALARSGATVPARCLFEELHQEELSRTPSTSPQDLVGREETLSMLARVYKDFGLASWPQHPADAIRQWETSLQLYTAAHSLRMDYFPGINAAAVATMLGRHNTAKHLADDVRKQALGVLDQVHAGQTAGDLYWLNATLGEALLITKDLRQAEIWYKEAARIGLETRTFGKMGSTLRQLKFLLGFLEFDPSVAEQLFPMPRVGICAGHMIDGPDRSAARFPESIAPRVSAEIRAWLDRDDVRIGFSSGACGADLLFLEALLERGGVSHMVLPFDQEIFRETSVAFAGETWVDRYRRILERSVVQRVSDRPLKFGEVAYDHANQFIHGLAMIYTQRLSTSLCRMVVWDCKEAKGRGGTGDVVSHWNRVSGAIDVIQVPDVQPARPLYQVVPALPGHTSLRKGATDQQTQGYGAKVVAVLFADVLGFSKMTEDQMPIFIEEFLKVVAEILDRGQYTPVKKNTWGDGLFLAFEQVAEAGRFALDLCDFVKATDWEEKGLPQNFGLRTALHAGPVYLCKDPVTELSNCIGTQVSHAARIEPITPVNEIYASETFAALAVSEGITEFVCRYVGHLPLAKDYGIHATYHVTRAARSGAAPPDESSPGA
jgi:class 3 adenylate cyclase